MSLTPEQILAAQKANVESLFGLTTKAFAGVEKLIELHIGVARAALQDSADHAQASLSVKDAQELLALQAALLQPLAEKTAAYSRHLYEISSGLNGEFSKAAEAKTAELHKSLSKLMDNAAQNAPAGTESAVAFAKQAATAASQAFESVQKAVKQASDIAEANLTAAVKTAASTSKKRSS
jgi:phasin family protein